MLPFSSQAAWKPAGWPDSCDYDAVIFSRPFVFQGWHSAIVNKCPKVREGAQSRLFYRRRQATERVLAGAAGWSSAAAWP